MLNPSLFLIHHRHSQPPVPGLNPFQPKTQVASHPFGSFLVTWLLLTPLLAVLCSNRSNAQEDRSPLQDPAVLKVMTYNLRYASTNSPHAWPDRRPLVKACIERVNPDLLGTQEGLYEQLKDLAADLPAYDWIGLGRDGGSHGEFMAIFFKHARFEPLEYDHFWLSDTPSIVASSTWGNTNRRMATWIRFRDRLTGREFYHLNTHLDHAIQTAREKGAALIRERLQALPAPLPIVLTGDFNAEAGRNQAYSILVDEGGFQDTWPLAHQRAGEGLNTFNGFQSVGRDGVRIDWILIRGKAEVFESRIVDFRPNDQFPSDHFPVVTVMKWLGP